MDLLQHHSPIRSAECSEVVFVGSFDGKVVFCGLVGPCVHIALLVLVQGMTMEKMKSGKNNFSHPNKVTEKLVCCTPLVTLQPLVLIACQIDLVCAILSVKMCDIWLIDSGINCGMPCFMHTHLCVCLTFSRCLLCGCAQKLDKLITAVIVSH